MSTVGCVLVLLCVVCCVLCVVCCVLCVVCCVLCVVCCVLCSLFVCSSCAVLGVCVCCFVVRDVHCILCATYICCVRCLLFSLCVVQARTNTPCLASSYCAAFLKTYNGNYMYQNNVLK